MATTLAPTREGLRDANIPTQFKNEPSVDFTNPENARRMRAAIEKVRSELGREYDLVIGGRHLKTAEKTTSLNPAKPSEIVGVHQAAGAAEVGPAMQAALKAFETWKYASVEERTGLLFRTSHLMRERKFELMAWMVFEVGKNWAEADGDIAELIDFCDFYALEAMRLSQGRAAGAVAGRARLAALHSAGRRRGDSAVEFPRRHHGRHDAGVHRVRQHRHAEAVERLADHRGEVLRDPGGSRPARRRGQLLPRPRRQLRQRHRRAPQDPLHRLHRLERSRPAHQPARGHAAARPDLDQAHRARDGRQGLDRRGCRRRSRRGGRGRRSFGVRLQRAEMLGMLARHRG